VNFNQLPVDQPQPEIAGSAVVLGEVHVGAGAVLAQGLVVRSHGAAVSIGNYSAILENGMVIGTPEYPVRVGPAHGLRSPRRHRRGDRRRLV
jgi:carbonic anhydrase/acetyltransferase-like protein (isoleucine patch superfamily)